MRILVNAISAKQGGIVTYTTNMIRWMASHKVDATFAVPHTFEGEGANILRLPASDYKPAARLLWEQLIWPTIVARHRPDVLFSSANFGLFLTRIPQVLLIREGGLFDQFYLTNFAPSQGVKTALMRSWRRRLILASAGWADRVVTPSAAMRDLVLRWDPELADKIEICTYGTRDEFFTPRVERRPWRADGRLRLIYVSVYYPHKNPGVIAEAARQLNREGLPTEATITMNIDDIASTRGGYLDALTVGEGVKDGLITLGHRRYEDLPRLYASHDIFVFPSVSESFGHPMAEAMSAGLPVVAADTSVNREICGDGAIYFDPFSPSDLAKRITELDANPGLRSGLIGKCQRRARSLYRWDDHMARLMSIFQRAIERRRLPAAGA